MLYVQCYLLFNEKLRRLLTSQQNIFCSLASLLNNKFVHFLSISSFIKSTGIYLPVQILNFISPCQIIIRTFIFLNPASSANFNNFVWSGSYTTSATKISLGNRSAYDIIAQSIVVFIPKQVQFTSIVASFISLTKFASFISFAVDLHNGIFQHHHQLIDSYGFCYSTSSSYYYFFLQIPQCFLQVP